MGEVTVYRTWEESMADMAVGLLQAEGISARKVSDMPRSVYPVSFDGLGEIEVVVPEDVAQEALDILAVRFSAGELGVFGDGEFEPYGIEPEDDEEVFEDPEDSGFEDKEK